MMVATTLLIKAQPQVVTMQVQQTPEFDDENSG
jgi:hypothetical protein